MILKELHNKGGSVNGLYDVVLSGNDKVIDYLSKAVIMPQAYVDLFEKKGRPNLRRRRLSILKITYAFPESKKKSCIWRECDTKVPKGLTKEDVALPFKAIWELGISMNEKNVGVELKVERGCCIPFFLRHPDHAARVATWIGVIGLLISVMLALIIR